MDRIRPLECGLFAEIRISASDSSLQFLRRRSLGISLGRHSEAGNEARFRTKYVVLVKANIVQHRRIGSPGSEAFIPFRKCGHRSRSPNRDASYRANIGLTSNFHRTVRDHDLRPIQRYKSLQVSFYLQPKYRSALSIDRELTVIPGPAGETDCSVAIRETTTSCFIAGFRSRDLIPKDRSPSSVRALLPAGPAQTVGNSHGIAGRTEKRTKTCHR
jgi:hypothetical protein